MTGFVAVAAARRCGRREIAAVCEDQPPRVQRNRPPASRRPGTPGRKHAVAVVIDYSTALGDPGSVVGHCDLSTQGRGDRGVISQIAAHNCIEADAAAGRAARPRP